MACGAAALGLGRRGAPSSSSSSLLLLLLLWVGRVESPGECVPAREVQPRCHTDFATEVVCCWNAPALPSANCTEAFRLRYRTNSPDGEFQVCLPRDRRGSGLCPLYTCAIPAQEFENVQYHFALDRLSLQNWTEIWNFTEEGDNLNVKPLPLVNVTIATESDLFLLHWEQDPRAKDMSTATMTYEVAYWLKGQEEKLDRCPGNKGVFSCPGSCRTLDTEPPCFAVKQESSEQKSCYEIYADQLTPHSDYVASVRYRLEHWGKTWSEWSSPCTWHNGLGPGDQHWKVIPWLSAPLVVVILLCYVCLGRVKEWQDSVPHPVVVMGKQISSPSFPEDGKSSSPRGVKAALLCHLCNRGKNSRGGTRPKASSGQRVESKVPRGGEVTLRSLVLHPEVPRIERSPIRCSQETGIGPEMPLEETRSPPEAPHADALLASLFRNAVMAGDTWLGPELCLAGQGAPCGPPGMPPDLPPQAPCLDHPEGSPQREAVGGSPESGRLSSNQGSTASLWAAGPAPHQGPIWGPSIPEEEPQGPLLWPHGPPRAPAGGFGPQRTGPGAGGPVGSLPLTASGYKSFDSLSQPTATFHQPWEEEEEEEPLVLRPGGQQIQLPLPSSSSSSSRGDDTSLPLGPGLCGQQLPFPRGQDSCEDDPVTGPIPPAVTPGPKDPRPHTSPGYQSFSSLLPKGTEAQGASSPSGPEPPYKPLCSVLRSGASEPPGGGTPFGLHLGGGRTTETSTWPGTLWVPHLGLGQDLGSLEEKEEGDFPGQRGLFGI